MSKTFVVDRLAFQNEFLMAINNFKAGSEFLPIHYYNDRLVVFCRYTTKDSSAMIGMYIEFETDECTLENGDVFYIKEPSRLLNTIKLSKDDRLRFTVTNKHIYSRGSTINMQFRLYDKMLASRDRTFWKPSKFQNIKEKIPVGITINSDTVAIIKRANNTINEDIAVINKDIDGNQQLIIGSEDNDAFSIKIENNDVFSENSMFSKYLFNVLGKQGIIMSETTDKRMITMEDKTDHTLRYCFVSKFAPK